MEPRPSITRIQRLAVRGTETTRAEDYIATEEPLEIRVEGPDQPPTRVAVTMRTPGHDLELALGFLCTEALIRTRDDVTDRPSSGLALLDGRANLATIRLTHPFDRKRLERNFYATSSCGICGKASIDQIHLQADALPAGPRIGRTTLARLPVALRDAQKVFDRTGGLHAAGLFDARGELLVLREDVGRHNALDKVIGRALLDGELPLHERVVMVSGRASFELVQKTALAGCPVLCAVSAPSSLAIEAAARFGITLVAFLRGDSFNVYCGEERIDLRR